ncbi:UDP-glucose 6-dehydrogenase [Helicobacter sp. 12S02232-10]|uniref:UDP-glucose dehydrogenase family protein n=1 Tax=Helicobacter sp. 12S02232-10 TaxID=1476197 RepID=UPI000BD59FD2|nr:nucleotide sugar dehydrogenase [Helicobacter sp. 12S02232-10]PAF48849.1 UDP-glucose 6-dehydrogenase [Helicobacter sp. 12S02232-10]
MKITVFGLGFVGLTTAVGFAKKGFNVRGCEIDDLKYQMLQNAQVPFFEENLEEALKEVLNEKLFITNDVIQALQDAEIIFYCIGTPMGEDGEADLSHILKALRVFAQNKNKTSNKPILVIKSTVPPSTSSEIFIPFLENLKLKNNQDFILANNPEFLREGFAYNDFMNPDRVVIGTQDAKNLNALERLYEPFNTKIIFTNLNTAEFIKYLSNTTLSMMISYANEMSMVAETIGNINIPEAFKTLHFDKRFSGNPASITSYIYPGMGFGGYCLPKDTLAICKKSKDKGYETKILQNIIRVNEEILDFHLSKICNEVPKNSKIGVLGLSFKPNSDDVRESKSFILIQKLLQNGFKNISAYDPLANKAFKNTYKLEIKYCENLEEMLIWGEVFIIATAWEVFKTIPKFPKKKIYNLRYIELD